MVSDTITVARAARRARSATELRTLTAISVAHLISHLHLLVLPPLFPLLKERFGIGYVELGFALTLSSVVSGLAQAPMGFVVDRFGARRILIAGMCLGGLAYVLIGVTSSYPWLLLGAVLAGLSQSVYHPADYAILAAQIGEARIGRAFSIHTFAGYLGMAIAPPLMLLIATLAGIGPAIASAGLLALAAAVAIALMRRLDDRLQAATGRAQRGRSPGVKAMLTPAILSLTGFYALLSLSTGGLQSFGVGVLMDGYDVPLAVANWALSAFLTLSALGVLAGGFVADRARRHGEVAAVGFGLTGVIVLLIATVPMGAVALVLAMGLAGFCSGIIAPSRDMLVQKAAPPGAAGRAFGIVSTGFNIGGTIGPLLFGFIMDHGQPRWVFGVSVVLMVVTALSVLIGERRGLAATAVKAKA